MGLVAPREEKRSEMRSQMLADAEGSIFKGSLYGTILQWNLVNSHHNVFFFASLVMLSD